MQTRNPHLIPLFAPDILRLKLRHSTRVTYYYTFEESGQSKNTLPVTYKIDPFPP